MKRLHVGAILGAMLAFAHSSAAFINAKVGGSQHSPLSAVSGSKGTRSRGVGGAGFGVKAALRHSIKVRNRQRNRGQFRKAVR